MTAKELIDRLAELPPDTPVCVWVAGGPPGREDFLMDAEGLWPAYAARQGDPYGPDWSREPADLAAAGPDVRPVAILA